MGVWISATRPRTLPAAVAPVLVGCALAAEAGKFQGLPALLCLLFALLAQVAANFANDYFDFVKGTDTDERVGPRRAVAAGLVSPAAMRRATWAVCGLAFVIGLGLLPFGGWPLLVIGVASLLCAVAYTGGPYPLGYHGLGDVFVFIFFGLVAVSATAYVQTGEFTAEGLLAGAGTGALAANILVANNYRDLEGDRRAGKKTLVVRFGKGFAQAQFTASHLLALGVPLLLLREGKPVHPAAWIPFLPLAVVAVHQCLTLRAAKDPAVLIGLLGKAGLYLAAYALALSLWLILRA